MTASIRIDDGTNPPSASTDNPSTFLGVLHTLSNFDDTGVLGWEWELVDRPIGSAAALSSTTTATTTMTPDVSGDYLVRLRTYADAARSELLDADEQVVGVRLAPPYDWAIPAAGETTQRGARGWAEPREEAIRDVHAYMVGGLQAVLDSDNAAVEDINLEGNAFIDGSVTIGVDALGFKSLILYESAPGSEPIGVPDRGRVYASEAGGQTELFYLDSAGNTVQLTSGGNLDESVTSVFGAGGAVTIADARQIVETLAATTDTLADADNGKLIRCTAGSTVTVTVNTGLTPGTSVQYLQEGAGQIQIAAGGGMTLRYPATFNPYSAEQWSSLVVTILDTNEALVHGDLEAV